MEIILLQDIRTLGKEGDTVKVKDGYARNFLLPKKLAMPCTAGAMKVLEAKRKKVVQAEEKKKKTAQELARAISKLSLTIPMESGADDALFGSVTAEAISRALAQEDVHVDKKNITVKEPIGKLGIYNAEIKLHPEIKETLRIWVVKK